MSISCNNNNLPLVKFADEPFSVMEHEKEVYEDLKNLASNLLQKLYVNFAIPFAPQHVWESIGALGYQSTPLDEVTKMLGFRILSNDTLEKVINGFEFRIFEKILCLGSVLNAHEDLKKALSSPIHGQSRLITLFARDFKKAYNFAEKSSSFETMMLLKEFIKNLPKIEDQQHKLADRLGLHVYPSQEEGLEALNLYVECALKILKKPVFHQLFNLKNFSQDTSGKTEVTE